MAALLRSFRAAAAVTRPTLAVRPVVRAFSASVIRADSHGAAPTLLGPGAKAGTVPTDEEQATGLERFELLGKFEGVDVFDMEPLESTRLGTVQDPIQVLSFFPERHVGCTGFPADSHDTVWLQLNTTLKNHRCPECGSVYSLNYVADTDAGAHGHHH